MKNNNINLAYCLENLSVANELSADLSISGINFQHFSGTHNLEDPTLSEQLQNSDASILLVISDNFLKSAQCMGNGIELLQKKSSQILPVVVDGVEKDELTGELKFETTQFDRVSDIIKYINYWQDQYLDLRRQKRNIKDINEEELNARLKKLRDISSEVGEFLRLLRSMNHLSVDRFKANDYEQFFRFIGDFQSWETYKANKQTARELHSANIENTVIADETVEDEIAPVDVSSIPGMDLLTETENNDLTTIESPELSSNEVVDQVKERIEDSNEELVPPLDIVDNNEVLSSEAMEDEINIEIDESTIINEVEVADELKSTTADRDKALELVKEGLNHFDAGEIEKALEVMEKAVELNPNDPELRYHYSLMLVKDNRDLIKAQNQLETVIEAAPDNVDAYNMLGKIAEQNKDFGKARYYYEKVLELDADYQGINYRLGSVILNYFEDQKDLASTYFQQAMKHNPKNAYATYRYAKLLRDSYDDQTKSIEYLNKVLEIQPDHPMANFDIAMIYQQLGERQLANDFYLKAVEINPSLKTEAHDAILLNKIAQDYNNIVAESTPTNTIEALKQNINRLEQLLITQIEEREKAAEPVIPPLREEVVFISGATSGIGRATAEIFAANNFRIIINGRRIELLDEFKSELEDSFHTEVLVLPFDVTNQIAVKEAYDSLAENWKNISILVNNAGKAKGFAPIHEGALDHWEEMIDTNVKGLLYLTRLIAPDMVKRNAGHIINVSSIAGKEVYPNGNVYCATKSAVEALTKAMRIDLVKHNIRVSQVSPGHVEETEFALVRFDGDEERARIYDDFNPVTSADVAESIYFIATRPPHVNIQDIFLMGTQQASATIVDRSGRS